MKARREIDLEDVRMAVIAALAADDMLGDMLVLKGGNALRLVHRIGERASLDVDYSLEETLPDVKSVEQSIERSLSSHFARMGLVVFDVNLSKRPDIDPAKDVSPKWGGYRAEFKLIWRADYEKYKGRSAQLGGAALAVNGNLRKFKIDLSCYEYTSGAVMMDVDGFPVRVYSLSMIVYEKLRALCQQMPEYPLVAKHRPRPRDFVDIRRVLDEHEESVFSDREIIKDIFAIKDVPLHWLQNLEGQKDFHAMAWKSVDAELSKGEEYYSECFARVIGFVRRLHEFGVV